MGLLGLHQVPQTWFLFGLLQHWHFEIELPLLHFAGSSKSKSERVSVDVQLGSDSASSKTIGFAIVLQQMTAGAGALFVTSAAMNLSSGHQTHVHFNL